MEKRSASTGLGSLTTGAVTALAIAVQTGLAAVVGVIIAREVERGAETDGFFAAYGVFIVFALAANAIRVTLLASFARARGERRLGSDVAASAFVLSLVAGPVLILGIGAAGPVAGLLTGEDAGVARTTATNLLPWMLAAGIGQVYAGVAASALAALDDYVTAALAFIAGSVAGLAVILLRISDDGVQAVGWGMTLNAAIAVTIPTFALARRARAERMPSRAVRPTGLSLSSRVRLMGSGIALPFALQAIYLVCLPLASREGEGAVTSFGYAYLLAAGVVGVTASSLGLVTSVPLTRTGLDPGRVARHVDASSWLALVVVAATAGVFAVAGAEIVERVLGSSYSHDVGSELGQVVVALAPFMVVSVALSVTFPLMFVAERTDRLPLIALGVLCVHVPLAVLGQVVTGLWGLSIALAVSTGLAFSWMLHVLGALGPTVRRLAVAVLIVAGCAAAGFVPANALLGPAWAAVGGLALASTLLAFARPAGLTFAWRYLRELS